MSIRILPLTLASLLVAPLAFAQVFVISAPTVTVHPDGADPLAIEVDLIVHQPGSTESVNGFSMAMAHDPAVLDVVDVEPLDYIQQIHGGSGPQFFAPALLADGWTLGCVFNIHGGADFLEFLEPEAAVRVFYEAPEPATLPTVSALTWVDGTLGTPVVTNTVVTSNGVAISPERVDGLVTIQAVEFSRGDCDQNGLLGLADVIFLELYLFLSGTVPECIDACDVNGDTSLSIVDVIYLLNYLFLDGPDLAVPFPGCGNIGGSESLGCQAFDACL